MLFLAFHDDRDDARELARRLHAVGVDVWCSAYERSREPGTPWPEEALNAIYAADAFAVVFGAHGIDGGLRDEVSHATARRREDPRFHVFPIALPSAPRDARRRLVVPKPLGIFAVTELPSDWRERDDDYFLGLAERFEQRAPDPVNTDSVRARTRSRSSRSRQWWTACAILGAVCTLFGAQLWIRSMRSSAASAAAGELSLPFQQALQAVELALEAKKCDQALERLTNVAPLNAREEGEMHGAFGRAYLECGRLREARASFRAQLGVLAKDGPVEPERIAPLMLAYAKSAAEVLVLPRKGDVPTMEQSLLGFALASEFKSDLLGNTFKTTSNLVGFEGPVEVDRSPNGWFEWRVRGNSRIATSRLSDRRLSVALLTDQSSIALWRPITVNLEHGVRLSWEWMAESAQREGDKKDGLYPCQVIVVVADPSDGSGVAIHYTWSLTHPSNARPWLEHGAHEAVGVKATYMVLAGSDTPVGEWIGVERDLYDDYARICAALRLSESKSPKAALIAVQSLSQHDRCALGGHFKNVTLVGGQ